MEQTFKYFLLILGCFVFWLFLNTSHNLHNYEISLYNLGSQHQWYFKLDKKTGDTWIWTSRLPRWVKIPNDTDPKKEWPYYATVLDTMATEKVKRKELAQDDSLPRE